MANPINFVTHIDNSQLERDSEGTQRILEGIEQSADQAGKSIDAAIDRITQNIATLKDQANAIREQIAQLVPNADMQIPAEVNQSVAELYNQLNNVNQELRNQELLLQATKNKQADITNETKQMVSEYSDTTEAVRVLEQEAAKAAHALKEIYEAENFEYEKYNEASRLLDEINLELTEQRSLLAEVAGEQSEVTSAVNETSQAIQSMPDEDMGMNFRESIRIQREYLAELEAQAESSAIEIQRLKKVLNSPLADGGLLTTQTDLENEIRNRQRILQTLEGEKDGLKQLQKEYKNYISEQNKIAQAQENTGRSSQTLRTRMYAIRNEMAELILAGKQHTDYYKELEDELGRLGIAYRETERQQRLLTQGGQEFAGVLQGVQAFTGGITAAQGVLGLFIDDNERLVEVQNKLRSLISIIIGLQQVQAATHSTSAFRIQTVRKATDLWNAANIRVAASLGISTKAAKGFMIALSGGLALAIMVVIDLYNKWNEKQKEIREEQERLAAAQNEFNDKITSAATSAVAQFRALQITWSSLNGDIRKQNKFLEENKSKFDSLGISVGDVNTAEKLFTINSDAVISSLMRRARAIAQSQAAMELLSDAYKKQAQYDQRTTLLDTGRAADWTASMRQAWDEAEKQARKERGFIFMPSREEEKAFQERIKEIFTGSIGEIENLFKNANNLLTEGIVGEQTEDQLLASLGLAPIDSKEKKALEDYYREINRIKSELIKQENANERLFITDPDALIDFDTKVAVQSLEDVKIALEGLADAANVQVDITGIEKLIELREQYGKNQKQARAAKESEAERKKQAEEWEKTLEEFRTYEEKRLDIQTRYDKIITRLTAEGYNERAKVAAQARNKELADLDTEILKQVDLYKQLFDDYAGVSTSALQSLIQKAKTLLENASNLTAEQVKVIQDQIAKLETEIMQRNPFKGLSNAWKEFQDAMAEGDSTKINKALANIGKSITGIVEDIRGVTDEIFDLFDVLGVEVSDQSKQIVEGLLNIGEGAANLAMGIASGNPAQIIQGAISAIKGLIKTANALFSGDNKREEAIKNEQKEIDRLSKAYKNLEKAIKGAYSTEASRLIQQQISNLEKQREHILKQIEEEEKKSRKNKDQSRIDEWKEELDEIDDKLEDLGVKIEDVIFGESVESAIDELASAWISAWESGEDAMMSTQDFVRNMIKKVIRELLNEKLADAVAELRKRIAAAFEDEDFSDEDLEDIYNFAENLFGPILKDADKFKDLFKEITGRSGLSEGIARASQDSVDELNGRFTVIQAIIYEMNENLRIVTNNSIQILIHVMAIHANTDRLIAIEGFSRSINSRLEDIETKGLKLQ